MNTETIEGIDIAAYDEVRRNLGNWIGTPGYGAIRVSGTESVQFLNGMISNDLEGLEDGGWMSAAFPNAKGRLLALVTVIRDGTEFVILTDSVTHRNVVENLKRFSLAGDFFVDDETSATCSFSLNGGSAAEALSSVVGSAREALSADRFLLAEYGGAEIRMRGRTRPKGVEVFGGRGPISSMIVELIEQGAVRTEGSTAETLRIEEGVPQYGVDMDENTVIPEIGLEDVISYTKGCYIGQEVIARIHFRGKVAKILKGIVFDDAAEMPSLNSELVTEEGRNAGFTRSATYSPILDKVISLAYIRSAFEEPGIALLCDGHPVSVTDLPFVGGEDAG